jgi:lipopolysaccharide/colanic/teichoic acid biosynthesis glycosyltransferase
VEAKASPDIRLARIEPDADRVVVLPGAAAPRADQVIVKRTLDVVLALALLVAILPLLLLVALAVACSSRGPILFKQRRVGRDGRTFWLYKFRTMRDGNDPSVHRTYYEQLVRGDAQPIHGAYKLADDPRVTRVGAILRRFSLDEFPQLVNVLRGEMSLVGPRPPLPYEVELYGSRELRRLSVTPGITGLWQVSGRSTLTFREMIELDLAYVENWSLWLDLKIVLRTPWVVLQGVGAR